MLEPHSIKILGHGHINQSQSSVDLVSIKEQVSWRSFIVISFGLSADQLISIPTVSDPVSGQKPPLHDSHCGCDQLDVGNGLTARHVLWTIGEITIAVQTFDHLLLIKF